MLKPPMNVVPKTPKSAAGRLIQSFWKLTLATIAAAIAFKSAFEGETGWAIAAVLFVVLAIADGLALRKPGNGRATQATLAFALGALFLSAAGCSAMFAMGLSDADDEPATVAAEPAKPRAAAPEKKAERSGKASKGSKDKHEPAPRAETVPDRPKAEQPQEPASTPESRRPQTYRKTRRTTKHRDGTVVIEEVEEPVSCGGTKAPPDPAATAQEEQQPQRTTPAQPTTPPAQAPPAPDAPAPTESSTGGAIAEDLLPPPPSG